MRSCWSRAARLLAAALCCAAASAPAGEFSETERRRLLQHGPWPPPWHADPGNRASGRPAAIALGARLFFDPGLSSSGRISCASCHRPERHWTDGRRLGQGAQAGERNTPSVADARLHRWFGWDGAADSLWAQSLRPLVDAREMGSAAAAVAARLGDDPALACLYRAAFGAPPPADDEAALAGAGKALAAFQETIASPRTPFDEFRDALARRDEEAAARYPAAARRGARLFVGRAGCSVCHHGPRFSNGEFHDIGIPFFVAPGRVDAGRHRGIERLKANPYNRLGRHSDGGEATATRHVEAGMRNFGEFRVPSLRGVALTAPYMHNGALPSLREVVRHYSELDEERLHSDGERILRRLDLSEREIDDLVAFLETLSAGPARAPDPPRIDGCP